MFSHVSDRAPAGNHDLGGGPEQRSQPEMLANIAVQSSHWHFGIKGDHGNDQGIG
jgi:hypothetical protein